MDTNIMTFTDSYKVSHYKQYPPKSQTVASYFESRGGEFDEVVFFGLQYWLRRYLEGIQITPEKIAHARSRWYRHFGSDVFNAAGWQRMMIKHEGRLPVRIMALPEGMVVKPSIPMIFMYNTDEEFPWLTNWLETLIVQVWYPCTVASQSRYMKQKLMTYAKLTGCPIGDLDFKLHDFGFRGVTCPEQAAIGGAAHLTAFRGTDTFPGCELLMDYYGADMPGFSICATEHSTITSWGRDGELDAYANVLKQYPTGLVACVSDSYDIYNAVSNLWGEQLKDEILTRDGTLVIRPDSGNMYTIVLDLLNIMWDKFGGTVNEKGYRVLDPHVRLIQGDGIDRESFVKLLQCVVDDGFCISNIACGSGGGLLQKMDRDTSKYAFKACHITIDGQDHDVWKDPVTDPGKTSKRGWVGVNKETMEVGYNLPDSQNALQTVFIDGHVVEQNFNSILKRCSLC